MKPISSRNSRRTRDVRVLIALCLALVLSGCGSLIVAQPSSVSVAAPQAGRVPPSVAALALQIQSVYASGNLGALRRRVPGVLTVPMLIPQLRQWESQHVAPLRVRAVHSVLAGSGRYVETLEFSADPRATPVYDIVQVQTYRGLARLVGSVSGIVGSNYRSARWLVSRTQHFVIYHSPYQLAGVDRAGLAGLEHQRAAFEREFAVVHLAKLTSYYLYPTVALMDRMTHGMCGATADNVGCANPYSVPPSIQAALWPTYHEPIHVYELAFTPPPKGNLHYVAPLFVGEGMAVALEDRNADPRLSDYCSDLAYAPLDACASEALRHVQPMSLLSDKGFHHANPADAYSLGGSFAKYLMLRYGYHRYGHFYYRLAAQPSDRVADYNVASHAVYGAGIQRLIHAWMFAVRREHV